MDYSQENPSEEYKTLLAWAKEYQRTHKTFTGLRVLQSFAVIKRLCTQYQAKTLLDWGCGKGQQYDIKDFETPNHGIVPSLKEGWGVDSIYPYDPAWEPYELLPPAGTRFDGVITTDALEYIPNSDMPWVLDQIFRYADKFVFMHTHTNMSTKKRPTGMDRPDRTIEWWLDQIQEAVCRHPMIDWVLELRDKGPGVAYRKDGFGYKIDTEINAPTEGGISGTPEANAGTEGAG